MTRLNVVAPRPGVDLRAGGGYAFGSFGELLQGVLPDGDVDFLVTFPIDCGSRVRFRLDSGGELRVFPSHKWKALALARMLMDASGCDGGGALIVDSELPVGKGLASSSADLVATARVLGQVLGLEMPPPVIEGWLRRIEPTDGVMYPGVVAFEHRRVRLRAFLGTLPPVTVVAVDEGGQVDTVAFNQRREPVSEAGKGEYARLLDRLTAAVRAADLAEVGAVGTRSAILNQRVLPKRNLDAMLAICREAHALGVVCAHSGTVIGIMLADQQQDHQLRLGQVRSACELLPGTVSLFHSMTFDAESARAF
jgi:L-threonine kinase